MRHSIETKHNNMVLCDCMFSCRLAVHKLANIVPYLPLLVSCCSPSLIFLAPAIGDGWHFASAIFRRFCHHLITAQNNMPPPLNATGAAATSCTIHKVCHPLACMNHVRTICACWMCNTNYLGTPLCPHSIHQTCMCLHPVNTYAHQST
jgi:hypothetical protein